MKLEELKKKIKLKILLRGATATGKSYACVKAAIAAAKIGKKVLFLDTQRGAVGDLVKMIEAEKDEAVKQKLLENIEFRDCFDWRTYRDGINQVEWDLIIVDLISYKQPFARDFVENAFRSTGYYITSGGISEKIANPDTFSLLGFMYGRPNKYERESMDELIKNRAHVMCTSQDDQDYGKDSGVGENLDGFFDIVLKLHYEDLAEGREYKGRIVKYRGEAGKEGVALKDPASAIAKMMEKI